jgi:hypothetical protein
MLHLIQKNFNVLLENYGLNNFQHRLFIRMATFIHNIVYIDQAPKLLKDQIKINLIVHKGGYNLRKKFQVNQPHFQSLIFAKKKLSNEKLTSLLV